MPQNAPDQEPSIEEILASIRQIISDDDDSGKPEAAPPPPPPPPSPSKPPLPPANEPENDVLELTNVVGEKKFEIDMRDAEPEPVFEREPEPLDDGESILTDTAASATLEGFARLAHNAAVDRGTHPGGITIEDIVREMMRPMLRDWLDRNLPPLVEKLVQRELEKLSRQAADD